MNKLIAVTIGDIKAIGIKIIIEQWKRKKIYNFIIISNYQIFKSEYQIKELNIIENLEKFNCFNKKKLNIYNIKAKNINDNALQSLKIAYKLTKNKKFIGILTLPLNKNEINKFADKKFLDQTSFFSKLEKKRFSNMVFIYKKKFFTPLTTHIELKKVHTKLKNKNYIINKILNLDKTLNKDFNIKNPKYIISGINPHAGEMGLISSDDEKYIKPIVKTLNNKNINILGPVSGDSIVNNLNLLKFDVFIFTYHDQALIPFKMLSNYKGVNYTSGLDIIRVSPSHGTAKNLLLDNSYNSNGILNSFKIIKKISNNRNKL